MDPQRCGVVRAQTVGDCVPSPVFRTGFGLVLGCLRHLWPGQGDTEQGEDDPLDPGEPVEDEPGRGVGG